MPAPSEYRYCARLGMTQAECAAHLGVSRAAVTKAKARLNLTFGKHTTLSNGREWQIEFYHRHGEQQAYLRYPWEKMEVGDWCDVPSYPSAVAYRASKKNAPKRFASITLDHGYAVRRAA